jgi:alginate O-acetyltransferase complex protein AlgJ
MVKAIFDKTKSEGYTFTKSPALVRSIGVTEDLAAKDLLPRGYSAPPTEELVGFSVKKLNPKSSLLGDSDSPGIVVLGSSYSKEWTRFPDALRYSLQRDAMVLSVNADKGSWVGMLTMLQDASFQTQHPKIVIWEMPERDLRLLPDYAYRDARYKMESQEWLARASALVQKNCKSSGIKFSITGGVINIDQVKQGNFLSKETKDSDYIEISFSKSPNKQNYLSFDSKGSTFIKVENYSPDKELNPMKFELQGSNNALKVPLYSKTGSLSKIRVYPGQTSGYSMQNMQVCNLPDGIF